MSFIPENFGDAIENEKYDELKRDYELDRAEPEICPNCDGAGEGQHETQPCGKCGGKGEI